MNPPSTEAGRVGVVPCQCPKCGHQQVHTPDLLPIDERKAAMKGRVGRYGWWDHEPDTADAAYECESDIDRCRMHPHGVWVEARRVAGLTSEGSAAQRGCSCPMCVHHTTARQQMPSGIGNNPRDSEVGDASESGQPPVALDPISGLPEHVVGPIAGEIAGQPPEGGAGRAVQDDGLRRAAENVIRWWDAAPPTFPEGEHVGPAIEGLRSALRAAPSPP